MALQQLFRGYFLPLQLLLALAGRARRCLPGMSVHRLEFTLDSAWVKLRSAHSPTGTQIGRSSGALQEGIIRLCWGQCFRGRLAGLGANLRAALRLGVSATRCAGGRAPGEKTKRAAG